jgi:hypothetical protein
MFFILTWWKLTAVIRAIILINRLFIVALCHRSKR